VSFLKPCSFCGSREPGKHSNATWAWNRADGQRVAWRQRLCVQCYITNVAGLDAALTEEPFSCPICHTEAGEAMDPCYLTIFIPGYGPRRLEMGTCGPCAVEIRNRAQQGGVKLDDSQASFGGQGQGPQTDPALEVWKSLGIQPRE